jgi:hypothetical protein
MHQRRSPSDVPPDALQQAAAAGEAIRSHLLELATGPNIFDLDALRTVEQAVQAGISIAGSLPLLWQQASADQPTQPRLPAPAAT